MSFKKGSLYIVATPIGNMGDMTERALKTLSEVDVIAVEDTRRSGQLLRNFDISTPMIAVHEHNERQICSSLLERIEKGESIALISDAGTPLLSDPGYFLVNQAREKNLSVVPVPGVSAVITALSVAGLPTDRFVFEGFLPAKSTARQQKLEKLKDESRTVIFYEAPHRIIDMLKDCQLVFGGERKVVLARELTKTFETVHGDVLDALIPWVEADENQRKGEFVVLIHGAEARDDIGIDAESERILLILLKELPVKQAAALAANITGLKKNALYQFALAQKDK
ncbi:MAG: 16S rRNA (cytidine(1402)-2'-O)-methyltransferase [Gammaproteobacteria bacterium]|nr:16S rRNA (cytidine(1402)-2'-O)-methyltransferase [Gammaproteobacteria bacterium]MCW9032087.1 16S rRNA (cytidine(1402)-2'-O)-methyltransferase [Gammaproteobacteria bacterium]